MTASICSMTWPEARGSMEGYYLPDYTAHKGIFADIDYIPTEDKSDPIVAIYDLNGKRVSSPSCPGIYIQKHASGRAEKIVK